MTSNRPYKRNSRVADEIRQLLASIFIDNIFIPEAGLLTVSKVKVTDDLKIAKVYLTFLENKQPTESIIEIIKSKQAEIRYQLGLNLSLKYTPQLRFFYDESLDYAEKINSLLDKINNNA